MPALAMSSMRAELGGGIAAICADGPVHVASDNLGFVKRANQILSNPAAHPHKPWGLQKDGDLWEIFHRVVCQKGAAAIKVTWTKGHITEAQVRDGTHSRENKIGNDLADTFADVGAEGFGNVLQTVAAQWAARQAAYASLIFSIQKRIIHIMKIDAIKRGLMARIHKFTMKEDVSTRLVHVAAVLPYADLGAAVELFPYHPSTSNGTKAKPELLKMVHSFFAAVAHSTDRSWAGRDIMARDAHPL